MKKSPFAKTRVKGAGDMITGGLKKALLAVAGILVLFASGPLSAADAAKGKKLFNKCKACHSLEAGKNKIGPHINGVFGRAAGSVEGFKYSKAMMDSGLVWDKETLDAYLAKPKELVPGTKMAFPGMKKEQQRQDLIAYLEEATQ